MATITSCSFTQTPLASEETLFAPVRSSLCRRAQILTPGTIISSPDRRRQYFVERWIGAGSFAQIYLARPCTFKGRPFLKKEWRVVKIYNECVREAAREVQFLRESSSNPHVLSLYDSFPVGSNPCLILEYLEETVRTQLQKTITLQEIRHIAFQILKGMKALEGKGISHCDLTPDNIGFAQKKIKIFDFNCARYHDELGAHRRYFQTRTYRAPETALGTHSLTHADMFSFALILFELLSNTPLLNAPSEFDHLAKLSALIGLPPPAFFCPKSRQGKVWSVAQAKHNGRLSPIFSCEEGVDRIHSSRDFSLRVKTYEKEGDLEQAFRVIAKKRPLDDLKDAFDLIRRTLCWIPPERLSIEEALEHPFFQKRPRVNLAFFQRLIEATVRSRGEEFTSKA